MVETQRHLRFLLVVLVLFSLIAQSDAEDKGTPIESVLVSEIEFEIGSDDVPNALEMVIKEAKRQLGGVPDDFAIRMLGKDLMREGITQSNRVGTFRLKSSIADILTMVLMKTYHVEKATDERLRMVWTIGPDPKDERKRAVLITTRRGASRRGLPLPKAFLREGEGEPLKLAAGPLMPMPKRKLRSLEKWTDDLPDDKVWSHVVSPETLEDEVKSISLVLSKEVTSFTWYQNDGYKRARLHFNEAAMLFAVINQYGKPVRWRKNSAATARLFAHAAKSSKVASSQSYTEAKLRREDLNDLVRGNEINWNDKQGAAKDWGKLCDVSPLMLRMEIGIGEIKTDHLANEKLFVANRRQIVHEAEMLALIATTLRQNGMENYDEEDYQQTAIELTVATKVLIDASKRSDFAGAKIAFREINNTCARCHKDWR